MVLKRVANRLWPAHAIYYYVRRVQFFSSCERFFAMIYSFVTNIFAVFEWNDVVKNDNIFTLQKSDFGGWKYNHVQKTCFFELENVCKIEQKNVWFCLCTAEASSLHCGGVAFKSWNVRLYTAEAMPLHCNRSAFTLRRRGLERETCCRSCCYTIAVFATSWSISWFGRILGVVFVI